MNRKQSSFGFPRQHTGQPWQVADADTGCDNQSPQEENFFPSRMDVGNDPNDPPSDMTSGSPHTSETTNMPFKYAIRDFCLSSEPDANTMPKFKLPLNENATRKSTKSRVCVVDDTNALPSNLTSGLPRTIVMIGATGAGKSTLIDGLVNYVYDIDWSDDFRFTIIDLKEDEQTVAVSQAKSQTKWITTYVIRPAVGSKILSELRVVDMPGFGDTAGIEKDNELVQRLGKLFAVPAEEGGIEQVDMVCLVVQASRARLDINQRYILNGLQEIFDKSIRENICAFITFADGNTPPVLDALKENNTPFQNYFTFNNSALYVQTQGEKKKSNQQFAEMFWEMGKQSYEHMFRALQNMNTKSLQLSKQVLDKRTQLHLTSGVLKRKIDEGLSNLDTLLQEKMALKQRKNEAEANKNFTYDVSEIKYERQDIKEDECVTNCMDCNMTCHFPCYIKQNGDKAQCKAMDEDGNCTVCTDNCHWGKHVNDGAKYELVEHTETKTYEDMKKKYYDARKGGDIRQNMVDTMKKKFMATQVCVQDLMEQMTKCHEELSTLALAKHSPLSKVEYLQMLRETVEREKQPGYKNRVKMFDDAIDEYKTIARLSDHKFNPWEKYIDQPELMGEITACITNKQASCRQCDVDPTRTSKVARKSSPWWAMRR